MFKGFSGLRFTVAATLLLACSAGARAADGFINVKLPYSIAYDLSPIQIELGARKAEGNVALSYHIYDWLKNDVGKGDLSVQAANGEARQTVSFTPPKYGWFAVILKVNNAASGVEKNIGVTPKFPGMHVLAQGDLHGGWNDTALQAFSGFLCDRTNTRMGIERGLRIAEASAKYGVTLIMQFEGYGNTGLDHVRDCVTKMKGKIKYWEVVNEPNLSGGADKYVNMIKQVYPLIKSIDPEAVVIGPDPCGVDLGFLRKFYELGGGKFVDGLSVHDYEGDEAVDGFHWLWKFGEVKKIMAAHGDAEKPIWQTERAIGAVLAGLHKPVSQAVWITLQRNLLEVFGVTNDHNSHYYVNSTGFNGCPTFVFSESGPHTACMAVRTRCAMTLNRKFTEKLDLGPTGNKFILGLLYKGKEGSTITLQNFGTEDYSLPIRVTGGTTLEVVDSFGNSQKLPVDGGKATVTVMQLPVYLRLTPEQSVTVPPLDFGHNIASEATFSYSAQPHSDFKILTNGIFEIYHDQYPWKGTWGGRYTGKVFNESPQTLEFAFPTSKRIGKMIVYARPADNPHCALLDYDLQYQNGQDWVTIEKVRAHCPPCEVATTSLCKATSWYQSSQIFVHEFKPVETSKLRLNVLRIARGSFIDMVAEPVMGWKKPPSSESLELREIEIYAAK